MQYENYALLAYALWEGWLYLQTNSAHSFLLSSQLFSINLQNIIRLKVSLPLRIIFSASSILIQYHLAVILSSKFRDSFYPYSSSNSTPVSYRFLYSVSVLTPTICLYLQIPWKTAIWWSYTPLLVFAVHKVMNTIEDVNTGIADLEAKKYRTPGAWAILPSFMLSNLYSSRVFDLFALTHTSFQFSSILIPAISIIHTIFVLILDPSLRIGVIPAKLPQGIPLVITALGPINDVAFLKEFLYEPNFFWGPNVLFDLETGPQGHGYNDSFLFSSIVSWYRRTGHGFDQGSTFNIQHSNVQGSN